MANWSFGQVDKWLKEKKNPSIVTNNGSESAGGNANDAGNSNNANTAQAKNYNAPTAGAITGGLLLPGTQTSTTASKGTGGGSGSTGTSTNNKPYLNRLNSLYDQIMNRKPFQYDLNGDLLYRQMADQYMQLGQQAMRDTMGQAAALTGGYGNSYAQQVGNQAFQQYMTGLNEQIPDLYQQALNAYLAQGEQLLQQYELTAAHPGYLQALQPTGSGGGTRAADVDYNSILQAMINGVGSTINAAAAEIAAAQPIVNGGVNVKYPLVQGAYYDNLNRLFKK